MVHKVFISEDGDEMSIHRSAGNYLYISIENREFEIQRDIALDLEDAIELHKELGVIINAIHEKNREPF
jgi:hypothetical protein